MALLSVGYEGDAIILSRTNKVTLVPIVTSYSSYNTFLYRQGDDIVSSIGDGGDAITRCSCTKKVTLMAIVTSYLARLKVRSNELKVFTCDLIYWQSYLTRKYDL